MTIPFIHLLEKAKAWWQPASQEAPASPASLLPLPTHSPVKPSSERLRKTIMPNTTRTVSHVDPFGAAAARSATLPPAVVLALEPSVERAISLELSDVIAQIPGDCLKAGEAPKPDQRVLLKASALEKGMAAGKPTIGLALLYEQMPEIFSREIPPSDATEVALPFEKVLEQFNSARIREDQERDPSVPQVETPILQVTLEDTARFGTTIEPLHGSTLPPVKVEPATAKSISEAEPETVVREIAKSPRPARSTIPLEPVVSSTPEPPRPKAAEQNPARIPFHLPPNGAGEPASERVPASSGPPVPTSSPKPSAPGRISFKITPPSEDIRPKLTLVPGIERKEEATPQAAPAPKSVQAKEATVAIPLRLVLESLPPLQLGGGNISDVPADAQIEFPLSLIQPQLASGRVAVGPKIFEAAMPENFRELFVVDPLETPVPLPLHEILKNLPGDALQMRNDQEEVKVEEIIETPFSIKAKEDSKRFDGAKTPAIEQAETSPQKIEKESPKTPVAQAEEEKKLDAREIVACATALPGVAGCSVTFADGLIVAQNFPAETSVEGLCAAAPALRQRIEQHMRDTTLGSLEAMTFQGQKSAVTFFLRGNICLTTLHAAGELAAETRSKLAEMTEQLTKTYAQPEPAHVDH